MTTSRDELSRWFDEGVEQGATHMIVVCDTFDWSDYPVYVQPDEDVRAKFEAHNQKYMQRVEEVYSLRQPKEPQLLELRAFHFD